ncbi:hypothetical protein QTP88_020418 [Uroleucon formosanum]
MSSRAHSEFEWNDEINFINIISALFNNWPEMKLVVDRTSEDSLKTVYKDIKKFIQNVFDFLLIYGFGCSDSVSDNIKKGMNDGFQMVIEDFAANEISTRICNMYHKWIKKDNLTENRKQIIEEIKSLPNPDPIVEFEGAPPHGAGNGGGSSAINSKWRALMPAVHIRRDIARAADRECDLCALASPHLTTTALGRKAVFCTRVKRHKVNRDTSTRCPGECVLPALERAAAARCALQLRRLEPGGGAPGPTRLKDKAAVLVGAHHPTENMHTYACGTTIPSAFCRYWAVRVLPLTVNEQFCLMPPPRHRRQTVNIDRSAADRTK